MRKLIKKILKESDDLQWIKDVEMDNDLTPAQILMRFDEFPLAVVGPKMGGFLDLRWDGNKIILSVDDREEFGELFVDNDSSQYGYVTKWLAEKVLSDDDYWEPYSDVVYDWEEQVWGLVESNSELLSYVVEHLKDNYVGEVEETITYEGENVPFDEKLLNHLASQNTAQLGFIIDGYDEFDDLKQELTWAYTNAYNIAAQDNIYKAIYSEIEDVFGKGEWKSIDTDNGTKHFLEFDATDIVMETLLEELEDCIESCKRYFNPNDEKYYNPDEYESELEAFEEYCEGCVDYPFTDYGHFLTVYRDYLDERDELFNPSFDEYPDNKDIAEYFAEDVYGRI